MHQYLRYANTPVNYFPLSPSVGLPCKETTPGLWFPSHVEACRGRGLHVPLIKAAALRLPAGPQELRWESTSRVVENWAWPCQLGHWGLVVKYRLPGPQSSAHVEVGW